MRRLLYITLMLLAASSCGRMPTFRINSLVGKAVQQSLAYSYSYDPVKIKVDSAFAPYDSPEYYGLMMGLYTVSLNIQTYDLNIKSSQLTMETFEDGVTADERKKFFEAREELQRNVDLKREAIREQRRLAREVNQMEQEYKHFIGYKVEHKYHALDRNLRLRLLSEFFLIDSEVKTVIARYDLSDEIDQVVREMIRQAQEEKPAREYLKDSGEMT